MNITNDLVTEYINHRYRPLSSRLGQLRQIGEQDNVPIILKETESFLNMVLALKRPKKILEIGTAIGYSALYFAESCEDAEIYTIEKNEYAARSARHNIAAAGLENRIHSLFGDGQEQIEKLRDQGIDGFDFVFIDAAKSHYKRFFDAAIALCEENALIISDNILQRAMTVSDQFDINGKHKTNIKKMREYVDYICSDRTLDTTLMSIGDGIAVSIYRGENG